VTSTVAAKGMKGGRIRKGGRPWIESEHDQNGTRQER